MTKMFVAVCLLLFSCSSTVRYSSKVENLEPSENINTNVTLTSSMSYYEIQNAIIREVLNYINVPYKKGGKGSDGIDCSAFVVLVFKNALGIILPRTSIEQFKVGKMITSLDSLRFGDLLFFNTTGRIASHVGIYIGDGLFAHASVKDGVTISSIHNTYYRKRFNGAKRIIGVGLN